MLIQSFHEILLKLHAVPISDLFAFVVDGTGWIMQGEAITFFNAECGYLTLHDSSWVIDKGRSEAFLDIDETELSHGLWNQERERFIIEPGYWSYEEPLEADITAVSDSTDHYEVVDDEDAWWVQLDA